MKGKLIAIIVLALLLCATVPMAATAAPTKTTITVPVYLATLDNTLVVWSVSDRAIGKISLDVVSGNYELTARKVTPGYHTLNTVRDLSPSATDIQSGLLADAHGTITASGTFDQDTVNLIIQKLQQGWTLNIHSHTDPP